MHKAYLGDGLYAEFDGYMLKLMANDANDPTDTVYLEPAVFDELMRQMKQWTEPVSVRCVCGHTDGQHGIDDSCAEFDCDCGLFQPAPAGGEARE